MAVACAHDRPHTGEHLERAVITDIQRQTQAAQKTLQQAHASGCTDVQAELAAQQETPVLPRFAVSCTSLHNCNLGAEGFEPTPDSSGNPQVSVPRAAKSGAVGARNADFGPTGAADSGPGAKPLDGLDGLADPLDDVDLNDGELRIIRMAWPSLSRLVKDAILRIVAAEGRGK